MFPKWVKQQDTTISHRDPIASYETRSGNDEGLF